MKKAVSFIVIFFVATTNFLFSAPKAGAKMYVSVQKAALKTDSTIISKETANLSYGDCVIIIESGEKKSKVTLKDDNSIFGWIANGSITSKKITKNKKSSINTSENEIALAGKGFSPEAEKAFKKSNKKLNYDEVDKIESITVSDEELSAFLLQGHLNLQEKEE